MLCKGRNLIPFFSAFAVWWHVIGCTIFVLALPLVAPTHQSAEWVFTTFAPDTSYSGIESLPLMFMLSLLGSQWAMVGYDAAAHMAEETEGADFSGRSEEGGGAGAEGADFED